ncbi:VOC family protein [Kitasatospora sp. NBC_01287]|uniref:VOC family protein n=1 Tax=Kitasatospora sp. NBC_01287 TaxID=2903573 RepID=UPI0022538C1A|nr:VOC family protein [Kitasatospora sp. NBC_01287]MCX4750818.1 VOC family protein [Kitasatospora sp. NBC_01287]
MKNDQVVTGGPCWVELGSADPAAAAAFYRELFGWRAETDPRPEAGGYTMLLLDGAPVAALTPLYAPGQPTAWSVSFAVTDTDATAAAVTAAGGQVVTGPMDVFDAGRFAVVADPARAVFALWQPRRFGGAAVFNRPGSLGWVELLTRDVPGALQFYPRVFGWSVAAGEWYTQWGVDGADFGGMMRLDDRVPAEVPPHWRPYFAVTDVDAVVRRAAGLGAGTLLAPMDLAGGRRIAVLSDPQGAGFGVYLAGTEG